METRRANMGGAMAANSFTSRAMRPQHAADSLQGEFTWKVTAPTLNSYSAVPFCSGAVVSCQVRFAERRAFLEK
eukprot:2125817-Pyramimonas_sp.AAC.1